MEKLRSQSGASMILALLFFLLCGMVGATVLAASASNAGKMSQRLKEQQEYFTMSSALQLVCDRLTKAEYRANAEVEEAEVEGSVVVKPIPSDPSTHYTYTYTYKKTTYKQNLGSVTFNADNDNWNTILSLRKELDYLFAERFTEKECNGYHGSGKFEDDDMHAHSTLGGADASKPAEHILKIKVTEAGLPGDALTELKKEVEIKVSLGKPGALGEKKYWLFLEAKLVGGSGKFTMKAELKPKSSFPHINDPGTYDRLYSNPTLLNPTPSPTLFPGERAALRWELVRIYKEPL